MYPLISVIIPIYNVEPYLKECLDSICNQTYQNLQVIMVNDGSMDKSEEIAKTYLQDKRFNLISQSNRGLSGARNAGLAEARGEWIYFIDSDDYIAPRYIEELLELALKYNVEMVCNDNIARFTKKGIDKKPKAEPKVFVPEGGDLGFGGAVWRFLFKADLLERVGVKFIEGKIYEDEAFLYMITPMCKAFLRFSGEPYFYRQRQDSIIGLHRQFRSYDLLDIFKEIYLFYQKNDLLDRFSPPFYFLYECGIGYNNEQEYLKRAKALADELKIPESLYVPPPHSNFKMQKFMCQDTQTFASWIRVRQKLSRIKGFLLRIASAIKRKILFKK